MESEFLSMLYKEEEVIYNRIITSSLYEDLVEIQQLIVKRGGQPRQSLGIKSFAIQESLFKPFYHDVFHFQHRVQEPFNQKWTWEKKTKYAFTSLGGKASPREVINFLEQLDVNVEKAKIAANVYNVILKLKKSNGLIKDESEKSRTVYILTTEDTLLNEEGS
ncbi:MAG: hypothetical protein V4547_14215 [Bacteroidota bacterium]